MDFIKTTISVNSIGIETVTGVLYDIGITGIQIDDPEEMKEFIKSNPMNWDYVDSELEDEMQKPYSEPKIILYTPNDPTGNDMLLAVKTGVAELKLHDEDFGSLIVETEKVDDKDWVDKWKEFYKPFKVGENLLIRPSWEDIPEDCTRTVLTLNPGQVFGTGLHQTTKLCIEFLEYYFNEYSNSKKNDCNIIDIGSGSGILALTSLLFGGNHVLGIDMEHEAEKVFIENAELNNIKSEKYDIIIGNILTDTSIVKKINGKYNLAVVNIVADVVIKLSPVVKNILQSSGEKGVFISSGIIEERAEEVSQALIDNGFNILFRKQMDNWVSFMCEI